MAAKRWERRKEDRSGEILEAALACFSKKGFAATRMEDIARGAKIAKGTVYLYFNSKQAVFKALARGSMGARLDAMQAFIAQYEGSSADLLRLTIAGMGEFARTSDRIVLPRLLLAEAGNFPGLAKFWRRELIDRGLSILTLVVRRGIESGEFREMPAEHVARLCVAPLITIAIWRTTFAKFDEEPYDYQGLIDAHLRILLRGISLGRQA
jgi:AcrR family transcriptional regulator